MLQYQRQGKNDESTQVAMQVLRSTAHAGQSTHCSRRRRSRNRPHRRDRCPGRFRPLARAYRASQPRAQENAQFIADPSEPRGLLHGRAPDRQSQGRAGQARRASPRRRRPAGPGRQPVGPERPDCPRAGPLQSRIQERRRADRPRFRADPDHAAYKPGRPKSCFSFSRKSICARLVPA